MRCLLIILIYTASFFVGATCLTNAETVQLSGKVIVKKYPDPLAENNKAEEPYERWVLLLNKKLECVTDVDKETFPKWNEEIQLFQTDKVKDSQLESLKNKNVTLAGQLSLAAGAPFEFTAVGLYVEKISNPHSDATKK
ncbi:hypothetical protein C9426_33710 [Serratia sp. S1B]|nr:hypothetical protein C9426_33710 [Serratia sp. S1B]